MKQTMIFKKILNIFILVSLLVQISACGWILHPERSGQRGGRIDPGIAVLDGVGLLFFLIPGIIAFAVDFSTGCIYLPGGSYSSVSGTDEIKVVHVDPAELNINTIKKIVTMETGIPGIFDLNKAAVWALNGTQEVPARFVELKKSGYRQAES